MKVSKRHESGGTLNLVLALVQLGSMMRALSEIYVSHRSGCNLSLGSGLGSAWFQVGSTVKMCKRHGGGGTSRLVPALDHLGSIMPGGGIAERGTMCEDGALKTPLARAWRVPAAKP